MLVDTLSIAVGSYIDNAVVASGATLPTQFELGELFYLTDPTAPGLYINNGTTWVLQTDATLLASLRDVTLTGLTTGQILQFTGSAWTNVPGPQGIYAPLISPIFTGTPTAPTADITDNSETLATTAFVVAYVASIPVVSAFNTRTGSVTLEASDIATALGFTPANAALVAPIASPTFTGIPAAPTAAIGTDTTQLATTAFVQAALGTGTLASLADVSISSPTSGQLLSYDGTKWINSPPPPSALASLTDVTLSNPTNADFLKYNGAKWVNVVPTLEELGDVTITSPDTPQALVYNGTGWVNGLTGALLYSGTWNPNTNTPTLTSGQGVMGTMYKVTVASSAVTVALQEPTASSGGVFAMVSTTSLLENMYVYYGATQLGQIATIAGQTINLASSVDIGTISGNLTFYMNVIDNHVNFGVGDFIFFNGTKWDKIDGQEYQVTTFNGRYGDITLTSSDVSTALGYIAANAATYAPLNSPAFTGAPTAPTPTSQDNSTLLATTAFVVTALQNFNGTVSNDITNALLPYAQLNSPAFSGIPTAPTASAGTSTTQIATTAFVEAAIGTATSGAVTTLAALSDVDISDVQSGQVLIYNGTQWANTTSLWAPLSSPDFSGTPSAPTPPPSTNNTTIATTAYVTTAISNLANVSSFNGRSNAVTLEASDISSALGFTPANATLVAPLASPVLTGSPKAPTPAAGDNSTLIATTAFVTSALSTTASALSLAGSLTDVKITSPATGQILSYVSGKWENTAAPPTTLSALADVSVSSPSQGQLLSYNGSEWTNINSPAVGFVYSGTWNAETNTPTLTSGTGTFGSWYRVTTKATSVTTLLEGGSYAGDGQHFTVASGAGISAGFAVYSGSVFIDTVYSISGTSVTLAHANMQQGTVGNLTFYPTYLDGHVQFNVGDVVYFDGTQWDRLNGNEFSITSFNTRGGDITLLSSDVTTALGFTPANATTVANTFANYAPLASPSLTGTPTAPTAAANTNTTQIATTAFVMSQIAAGNVTSFNTRTGAITLQSSDVTTALGFTPANATSLSNYAPLASPSLTGTPVAPTAVQGTNNTQIATTQYVTTAISAVTGAVNMKYGASNNISGATSLTSAALGSAYTLNGSGGYTVTLPQASGLTDGSVIAFFGNPSTTAVTISVYSGDSINVGGTTKTTFSLSDGDTLSLRVNAAGPNWIVDSGTAAFIYSSAVNTTFAKLASPALTGIPTTPTATTGTSTTQIASTAFVGASIAPLAPIASPALTGTPTAPTAAANTSTTQIATTAYVITQIGQLNLANLGTVSISSPASGQVLTYNGTNWVNQNSATGVASFNTRTGAITLQSSDVTTALGFTPANATTVASLAPLASPSLTGTPTAPTANSGTSTTQIATTAFVQNALSTGGGLLQVTSNFPGSISPFTGVLRWVPNAAITLVQVSLFINTAPTSTITVDVLKNGVSVFSGAKPMINAGANSAGPFTISSTTMNGTGDYLTMNIVSGSSGSDMTARIDYT
jgi:hypothetical protein